MVALAEKHAPVLLIPEAGTSCAEEGDPFFPVPVDVVLDNPEVALVADGDSPRIVRRAPAARDLFGRDRDHWLDLPGDPRNPGCAYQQDFEALLPQPAVGYARVASDPSRPGLALQYWLFYYFNGANNTHEGDWELIQLSFAAGTAEEALLQEPQRISLAQHRGGETGRWDDPKVRREGDHPVVVVAAGSHAGYFRPGLYLRRSDLSCEDATGPFRRVAIAPIVVPPAVADPASPFAWLTYEGRWGQPAGGRWDGPTGPNTRSTWRAPIAWEAGLGGHSITLGDVDPATSRPHRLLCAVAGLPAAAVNLDATHPLATRGLAALLVVLAGGIVLRRRMPASRWSSPSTDRTG